MRVYLADLFHVYNAEANPDAIPYTVPLGIGYLASALKHHCPDIEVRLFRDPDKLLNAVRTKRATMVGFSVCSWNTDLTRRVAEIIKAEAPETIVVGGGPSVDDADAEIVEFFRSFPSFDYLIPNEGESGLIALTRAIQVPEHRSKVIDGVACLDEGGHLLRGPYRRPVVPTGAVHGIERISPKHSKVADADAVAISSPYLDGSLDEFLDDGLVPIIQTMRGCPYQCHFCVSGATEWNRMRAFDLDRVIAEIEYAFARSKSKDLILTDENWGILGQRDVAIARYLKERRDAKGAPSRLYYYTAKIVTEASKEIVETVASMAWIGEFNMSFQSLNPETRKAIKRTNIGMDKLAANIQWARERKIPTSSEMIYGFPYETPQTFFDGVERLTREGVNSVTIYPLQLFPGIDLATSDARDRYAIRTRFRLTDGAYGVYDGGTLVSAETEEVVVATRWSSEDDYLTVRRYGLFQQAMLVRRYLVELLELCKAAGSSGEGIVGRLAFTDYTDYPVLSGILADHRRDAELELMDSREQVRDGLIRDLRESKTREGVKLNLVYLGRMMSSPDALRELLVIIHDYFDEVLSGNPYRNVVMSYIREVLPNQIVLLTTSIEDSMVFSTRFDYAKWRARQYGTLSDLLLSEPKLYIAVVSDVLRANLRNFDRNARADLQGIFDRTSARHLVRNIEPLMQTGTTDRRADRAA